MPPAIQNIIDQFAALSRGRQITLGLTAVGSLAFFLFLSTGTRSAEYRLLYRGLEATEIAEITDGLTAERIDYQLGEGGTAVLVQAAQVHEARMRIASRGLPSGGAPGFEIFDRGTFGVTDFVQKVNYHRALQGELARTIEQVQGVEKARVQLAIPSRKTLLRRDQRQATASVVTRLSSGWDLDAGQVRGIVHLVASSVEGLDPAKVTLVDDRGRLLAPQGGGEGGLRGDGSGATAARRLESDLEDQIESMLGRTIGLGRVVAKVNADLDWTQTEKTEEIFDPNSQVARSTQTDIENSNESSGGEGGVAGIVANTPDVDPEFEGGGSGSQSTRESETVNYEISKVVSRHVLPTGRIEKLSVAVLVDGKPAAAGGDAESSPDAEGTAAGFVPWSAEELEEFEELAKRAVGFSSERGDEISVINAPFIEIDPVDDGGGFMTPDVLVLLGSALHALAFLVGLLLFARFFVRPLADAVSSGDGAAVENLREELMATLTTSMAAAGEALPEGEAYPDMEIPGLDAGSDEMTLPQQVDRLAQLRTEDSVRTIRGWMAS